MTLLKVYVFQWCFLFGMQPIPVEAKLLDRNVCQATYDGFGPLIQCDPRKIRGFNLKDLALHEVAHLKLEHPNDGRSDRERHKDPAFKALLKQGKDLWP